MRYLGNKHRIINHIDNLVTEKHLHGGIFADLFSGTGTVSDHFKDRFHVVANDLMDYASVLTKAKLSYAGIPNFNKFINTYGVTPWLYFNQMCDYSKMKDGFITNNYSPKGNRMYFTVKNAKRIDGIRFKLSQLRKKKILSHDEFVYLLACLIENVMSVSNTSGTYGAFFKKWESRAKKTLMMRPLSMESRNLYDHGKHNRVYTEDTNKLVRHISGNVAYIDPPYTAMQYSSAYHVLETIARGDHPKIHGKIGNRNDSKMSPYSRKSQVLHAFEDLLRQLRFKHVIISYSTQSLIPLPKFVGLIKKFAIGHKVEVHYIHYREYKNVSASHNHEKNPLREVLIYFKKDFSTIKSPLDYAGSKDRIMDKITSALPAHISNFVDAMGGAFNVGSNVVGTGKTYYNEINPFAFQIVKMLATCDKNTLISGINQIIKKFDLKKGNKKAYLKYRNYYNHENIQDRTPAELYVLTIFGFQHMIRFNVHKKFNIPFGNTGMSKQIINKINNYHTKMPIGNMTCKSCTDINIKAFDSDTVFYFDPPYTVTSAVYNDGKRYKATWTSKSEQNLLKFLDKINKNHQRFLMSNVIKHRGKTDTTLVNWLKKRHYTVLTIGKAGAAYPRKEVLIKNY